MADADVFGIPGEDSSNDDWLKAGIEDATQTPAPDQNAPAPPATPATPAPQPIPGATPPGAEPVVSTDQPADQTPAEKLWANKFSSPEELEKGYRSATNEMRRANVRARELEGRAAEIMERNRQLEQTFQRALPYLQRMSQAPQAAPMQQQRSPAQGVPYGEEYQQPQPQASLTPDQVMPYIEQLVSQRTDQIRAELADQMQREEYAGYASDAIDGFFDSHPEVEQYGEADDAIVETMKAFNQAWQPQGKYIDVTDGDHLERLYEASKREALSEVLLNNPRYIETESGMTLARFEASLLEGSQPITQGAAQVPASMVGQRPPVVERASTGPSPEGAQPADEFEEAVLQRNRSLRSTFGGSVF
jgi:hypothetical protein